MSPLLAAPRSVHVVPGSNERFLAKAGSLDADALMFDLEDGVAPAEKARARGLVTKALANRRSSGVRHIVRVNACDTPWMSDDVAAVLAGAPRAIDAIALPKASSATDVQILDGQLSELEDQLALPPGSVAIDVIIETARGLVRIDEILDASPRVQSVFFGPLDFAASIGMSSAAAATPSHGQLDALMGIRLAILVAGRSAGVVVLDGPHFRISDTVGLRASAASVAELGFDGKLSIHPDQIQVINDVFTPSVTEFEHAQRLLAACREAELSGSGAIRFEGAMIDEATRKLAETIVVRGTRAGTPVLPSH